MRWQNHKVTILSQHDPMGGHEYVSHSAAAVLVFMFHHHEANRLQNSESSIVSSYSWRHFLYIYMTIPKL